MTVTNTLTGETAVFIGRTWGVTAETDAYLVNLDGTVASWLVSDSGTPTYS